jgi:hypothetical protein
MFGTIWLVLGKWQVAYDPCFCEGWLVQLARQQTGESLEVNWTEFSSLSLAVFVMCAIHRHLRKID